MTNGGRRRITLPCVLLVCALACTAVVYYTDFPVSVSPCTYYLSRTLLAVTGLDTYIVSCDDEASAGKLRSSDGGGRAKTAGGRPIVTDILHCRKPALPPDVLPPYNCCPPMPASEPIDFRLPDPSEPLRTRRPAHVAGADYMAKYERAIALMKALPRSDPRSFYQQAKIHCAYCTGAYRQVGHPELPVQIHFSWFFFPLHRAYIYFFERIAGKLLGDPEFGVPFWSWDVPEGMRFPVAFANASSPLYDPLRNPRHAPPKLVDLDFCWGREKNYTDEQQIQYNLRIMYNQMITNSPSASLFYGQPFRAGEDDKPGPGPVELYLHNTMHVWTGDTSLPNTEDMGGYYSAGRDPVFYSYHANIDRLWETWRNITSGDQRNLIITDPDWLESSFLFYDEEARLVRITVRDVLNIDKLRYAYDGVDIPWLNARPPQTVGVNNKRRGELLESIKFPLSLDTAVTVEVRRPPMLWRRSEKAMGDEVLVIEGIKTDGTSIVKFDVFINAREYEKVEPSGREMAGSFVCLKHQSVDGNARGMGVKTTMRLALNEILEDLGAKGDDSVSVTLVPRHGNVWIGGLRIDYSTRE
ncbi:hypothetical protein GUJ93_ZPchr0007g3114 [Zizania palustris]|uniref:Tyrosinase copper-binding domain-containing protein n=1 Tax=Zizania palustris TaxID=103762 RepID=A0A8J5SQH5_ZIZPA|nr:hypothetical protein GUJ93_ZPchr0007g3114 [Zizania palustris]